METISTTAPVIPEELAGQRLDMAVTHLFPEYSRARLQRWIKAGQLRVNGTRWRGRDAVSGGECIELNIDRQDKEDPSAEPARFQPEAMALDIVHEDEHLLVINKPAGMVVHPAAGNWTGTLLNGLLHYAPELEHIPRAGIVHRLDKDTTGLMVVTRNLAAHKSITDQLAQRTMGRQYRAIVFGVMTAGGTINEPIARHPVDRKRQAVCRTDSPRGKPAITHYRVVERFRLHTDVQVNLETGRTHQIRVHMSHHHHPLIGDQTYGGRNRIPGGFSPEQRQWIAEFPRQALHAQRLTLQHPVSGETLSWKTELPADMIELIKLLRADCQRADRSKARR